MLVFVCSDIHEKILPSASIFLLALCHSLVTCTFKFNFLSIVAPRSFWEPELSRKQVSGEIFVLMSRLDGKWHLSWLALMIFSWSHLKRHYKDIIKTFLRFWHTQCQKCFSWHRKEFLSWSKNLGYCPHGRVMSLLVKWWDAPITPWSLVWVTAQYKVIE